MTESPATEWYQFGDGVLGVRSADTPFRDRFRSIFGECSVQDPGARSSSTVVCSVRHDGDTGLTLIAFEDPEPLDAAKFASTLFADRLYEVQAEADGWSVVGSHADGAAKGVAFRGPVAIAPSESPWQPLLGNLAVNRVLRLQRGVAFLHAASVVVAGRGVLISGARHAGKTTVSTALAARGHGFLSDEMSAVRLATRELMPFRRAISFREGPKSSAVDAALAKDLKPVVERYPDGTPRRRAQPSDLFPCDSVPTATLDVVLILRSFAGRPEAERFTPSAADTGLLAPFASSLWDVPAALRAMRLGALFAGSKCYYVDVGDPDATAELIEQIVEDECP